MNINNSYSFLNQQNQDESSSTPYAPWHREYSYSDQTLIPPYHQDNSLSRGYPSRASSDITSRSTNSQSLFPYLPNLSNSSLSKTTHSPIPRINQSHLDNSLITYADIAKNYQQSYQNLAPWNAYTTQSALSSFPISNMAQTSANNIFTDENIKNYPMNALQEMQALIKRCALNMGTIISTAERLGTCVQISSNLIITARHVVVKQQINELFIFLSNQSFQLEYVVEESKDQDYAIIQFTPSSKISVSTTYPTLSNEASFENSILLHYPKRHTLQASVGSHIDTGPHYSLKQQGYHESNSGSSGGGYFNADGALDAIHLGRERGEAYREAISLQEIITKNENSIIAQFIRKNLFQEEAYRFSCEAMYLDDDTTTNPFLCEEGIESKKILMDLLGDKVQTDTEIVKTKKTKEISFAKPEYIENIFKKYPNHKQPFIEQCSYQYGLHKETRAYSTNGWLESDHLIPYDVWCSTTNIKMKQIFKYAVTQQKNREETWRRAFTSNHHFL